MAVFRGLAFTFTKGAPIGIMDKAFNRIGSGNVLGIPNPVVILIVVAVAFYVLLNYTYIGRHIYAIGGNAVAAGLTGINIQRYKLGIYALSGLIAGRRIDHPDGPLQRRPAELGRQLRAGRDYCGSAGRHRAVRRQGFCARHDSGRADYRRAE